MSQPKPIRLIAQDGPDLEVISAAVQDAVTQIGNLSFSARQRRFSIELNRFVWERPSNPPLRVRALLAFDSVLGVQVRGLPQGDPDLVVSLLQVRFEPGAAAPEGRVVLLFAGDGEIALRVEALDATLLDSGVQWPTRSVPGHDDRKRR
ncbi:MAG: DUF2948 family protein [Pseudomonadota bacterium]